jgi:hypothetical protein
MFDRTLLAYPNQEFEEKTMAIWREDWADLAAEVGMNRFLQGAKIARSYSNFFPTASSIRDYLPSAKVPPAERVMQEIRDCERRMKAGERFYTLGDVFEAVATQIVNSKIKPSNPEWSNWAAEFLRKVEMRGGQ